MANEIAQATGSLTRMIMAKEGVDWGVASAASNYKQLNVIPGESLDINLAVYESRVIRPDRMANKAVRGTQRPGGVIPQELSPLGQAQMFYALLGNLVSTTGSGPYTHILKGIANTSKLPSYSIEKGFLDLDTPTYQAWLGSRFDAATIDFNIDAMVQCNFSVLSRAVTTPSTTSILAGSATDQTCDPFTGVQVTISEGTSLVALGTAQQLQLSINNNHYANNFGLGSNYRANMKAGTRRTSVTGTFMFNDYSLYTKALDGTDTKINIVVSDGTNSYTFLLPNVDLYPNGMTPKIVDGPITVSLMGMAAKDSVEGTDIKLTIVNSESSIST